MRGITSENLMRLSHLVLVLLWKFITKSLKTTIFCATCVSQTTSNYWLGQISPQNFVCRYNNLHLHCLCLDWNGVWSHAHTTTRAWFALKRAIDHTPHQYKKMTFDLVAYRDKVARFVFVLSIYLNSKTHWQYPFFMCSQVNTSHLFK